MTTATTIRERPILMNGPMIRAILDGRKTQTRRIIKGVFDGPDEELPFLPGPYIKDWDGLPSALSIAPDDWEICPWGVPGERLWVRETWRCNHFGGIRIEYRAGGPCFEADDWPKGVFPPYAMPETAARVRRAERQLNGEKIPDSWRPSIHMPRWASRLTLEITRTRVQHLNRISEADAIAEGAKAFPTGYVFEGTGMDRAGLCHSAATTAFACLWDEVYGDGAWGKNPYVWVVEFRVVQGR